MKLCVLLVDFVHRCRLLRILFVCFLIELKLGLIAESCLNPGFSTMIANIFAMRSDSEVSESIQSTKFIGFDVYHSYDMRSSMATLIYF